MSPHLLSFRFLFSPYSAVLPLRRRKLKPLSLSSFPSSITTAIISSCRQGYLPSLPSAGTAKQELSTTRPSPSRGIDNNGNRKKRRRRRKETANEGDCVLSAEEASIRVETLYQQGDPLGRKELGRSVVLWLKQGMQSMASNVASAELRGDVAALALDWGLMEGNLRFLMLVQPHLSAIPMPKGQEVLCLKASTHYPTLFDHFQRELRDILMQHQTQGLISDWRSTQSWKILKEFANSAQHGAAARKPKAALMHSSLRISLDKAKLMQAKIEDYVKNMSDLLNIERDAELEFTQEELNATTVLNDKSLQPLKPVEYLVSHGQGQQEQCNTICNLNVISSSTGMGGFHLVLFRVEGGHKLPPATLSPGDMVCVRTCNSQGEVATSCMQGFVNNLGEDGCSVTVSLESRRGDPTFSRLFG